MRTDIREFASEAEIAQAYALEIACYPAELAATHEAFLYRWRTFPSLFLGAWEDGRLVGLACGVRTDAADCSDVGIKRLHGGSMEGRKLCVLSVAVDERTRKGGLGAALVRALIGRAKEQGLAEAMLMCQPHLIGWYERLGFYATGLVHDEHGGVSWHDMAMPLTGEPRTTR